MMRLVPVLAFAALLTACPAREPEPAPTPAASPTPTATASASARGGARSVAEETDDFLFEYSYPAEAGKIAELATILDVWLEQRREELAGDAAAARREARQEGFPYNKHSYSAEWKVVAELPQWLSLSADIATYTGGAHGNYTIQSLVWDKEREQARDAMALFASSAALEQALGERFCAALNAEREQRRGEPVPDESSDQFDQCPDIDDLEVVLGSSNRRTFNRLTLYAAPYVAGAYAEGAYEIDIDVDDAILDAVKPDYREAFSARN